MSCWYHGGATGTGECRSPYGRKCVVDSTMNWLFEVNGEEGGGALPGAAAPVRGRGAVTETAAARNNQRCSDTDEPGRRPLAVYILHGADRQAVSGRPPDLP